MRQELGTILVNQEGRYPTQDSGKTSCFLPCYPSTFNLAQKGNRLCPSIDSDLSGSLSKAPS